MDDARVRGRDFVVCPHCWAVNPPSRYCARCLADMTLLLQESGGRRWTAAVQSPVPVRAGARLTAGSGAAAGQAGALRPGPARAGAAAAARRPRRTAAARRRRCRGTERPDRWVGDGWPTTDQPKTDTLWSNESRGTGSGSRTSCAGRIKQDLKRHITRGRDDRQAGAGGGLDPGAADRPAALPLREPGAGRGGAGAGGAGHARRAAAGGGGGERGGRGARARHIREVELTHRRDDAAHRARRWSCRASSPGARSRSPR